jgi:serine/threonine-protein kinase RsbW
MPLHIVGRPAVGALLDVAFAAVPQAASAARRAVADALIGRVDGDVLADAELVVCELVTNSVRHAGLAAYELIRVSATISDGVVRIEVGNPGTVGTIVAREPDLERGGGFGLGIVEAVAHGWGVVRDDHTRVWVELRGGQSDYSRRSPRTRSHGTLEWMPNLRTWRRT